MTEESGDVLDDRLVGEVRRHSRPAGFVPAEAETKALHTRLETAERDLAELRARMRRVERRLDAVSLHDDAEHTLFVPAGEGYAIAEAEGPPPRTGEELELDGRRLRVLRVGRSPFPVDRRPCVYLVEA